MKKISLKIIVLYLAISIAVLSCIPVYAIDTGNNSFSKEEIKKDVDFLFDKLERIHLNLYYSSNKEEIKEKIKDMINDVDASVNELEFYKKIAPIVSMLNDGHTSISFPDSYIKKIQAEKNVVPIRISINKGKIFIDNIIDKEYFDKYKGYEVVSIDSKAGTKIYGEIKKYVFGEKQSFKDARIAKDFIPLYYLENNFNNNYILELKASNKKMIKLNLKGISNDEYESFLRDNKDNPKNEIYNYKVINGDIALMKLDSFTDLDRFKAFLEDTFRDINKKNIKELVIDLRENSGGDATLGDLLVEYIYDGKYKRCGKFGFKITKEILDLYEKNNWMSKEDVDKLRKNIGQNYEENKIESYRNFREKPVFNGDIYVLIGSNTFSAAAMFASIIQDYNIGYLIGDETGGLATSYTNSYYFNLPNTKLKAGVSFQYIARPNGLDTGRGVLPDYYEKDIKKDALDIAIDIIKTKRD